MYYCFEIRLIEIDLLRVQRPQPPGLVNQGFHVRRLPKSWRRVLQEIHAVSQIGPFFHQQRRKFLQEGRTDVEVKYGKPARPLWDVVIPEDYQVLDGQLRALAPISWRQTSRDKKHNIQRKENIIKSIPTASRWATRSGFILLINSLNLVIISSAWMPPSVNVRVVWRSFIIWLTLKLVTV